MRGKQAGKVIRSEERRKKRLLDAEYNKRRRREINSQKKKKEELEKRTQRGRMDTRVSGAKRGVGEREKGAE